MNADEPSCVNCRMMLSLRKPKDGGLTIVELGRPVEEQYPPEKPEAA